MKDYLRKYGTFFVIILLAAMCLYLMTLLYTHRGPLILWIGFAAMLLIGLLPAVFIYISQKSTDLTQEHRKAEELLRHTLDSRTSSAEQADDIMELTLINTKELRYFYIESRQQAKKAFFLASTISLMGALILFFSIAALLLLKENTPALTLGAVGGTIVELISGTTFYIYHRSLKQLNHYYRSLHENERLLMILNLTCRLSKDLSDRQADMYVEIIRSQLGYINREFWREMEKEAPEPGSS